MSEELMPRGEMMTAFPCGNSTAENVEYRLYFEPSERPSKMNSKFIGLYRRKCIEYLAEVKTIVIGMPESGEFNNEQGELSEEERVRTNGTIEACHDYTNLPKIENRYYLLDQIYETEFKNTSPGGCLNHDEPTRAYFAQTVVESLKGKTFE